MKPSWFAFVRRGRTFALTLQWAVAALLLASSVTAGAAPEVPDTPAGAPAAIDGIPCNSMEGRVLHIHAHLEVFVYGKPIRIPNNVGHPETVDCYYWLHTHTANGLIHVESPYKRTFTLGEFFDVWHTKLSPVQVGDAVVGRDMKVWVDGKPYAGDPRAIQLADFQQITIEAGPPYHEPQLMPTPTPAPSSSPAK